jgi:hypothetical protein
MSKPMPDGQYDPPIIHVGNCLACVWFGHVECVQGKTMIWCDRANCSFRQVRTGTFVIFTTQKDARKDFSDGLTEEIDQLSVIDRL